MANYEELQRRKKFNEALIAQSMQQDPNQMVSGRSVPYSPIQGISKLVQAYLGRQGAESAEQELQVGKEEAMKNLMQTYQGTPGVEGSPLIPQTGGPLRDQDYTPFTPEQPAVEAVPAIEADPMKAAMMASTDPYLEKAGPVIAAMMKAKQGGNVSPYFTPEDVVTKEGDRWIVKRKVLNRRTGEYTDAGKEYLSKDDPRVKAATAGQIVTSKAEAERTFSMSGIGEIINEAETILTTGEPTESSIGAAFDWMAGTVGAAPSGSVDAQRLKTIGGALVAKMPRMEGPQSDRDVALYKEMAAMVGDATIPVERRAGALEQVKKLWGKYEAQQPSGASPEKTDLSLPPEGWDVEDYNYLTDEEKNEAHGI